MKIRQLLFLLATLSSTHLAALQLGEAELGSKLGEPLQVSIMVSDPEPLTPEDVIVRLGSAEEHQEVGVDKGDLPQNIKLSVEQMQNQLVVKVATPRPVSSPVVDFLLVVQSPDAEVRKAYTLLIDLP